MGGGAAIRERKSGDVWGILCGSDAIRRGDCQAAASGGQLSHGDGFQLPRRMDVPSGSLRAVVQRVVVQWTGTGYYAASNRESQQPSRGWQRNASGFVPGDPSRVVNG